MKRGIIITVWLACMSPAMAQGYGAPGVTYAPAPQMIPMMPISPFPIAPAPMMQPMAPLPAPQGPNMQMSNPAYAPNPYMYNTQFRRMY